MRMVLRIHALIYTYCTVCSVTDIFKLPHLVFLIHSTINPKHVTSLKPENCHEANLVVNDGTESYHYGNPGVVIDDKIGIMPTVRLKCVTR